MPRIRAAPPPPEKYSPSCALERKNFSEKFLLHFRNMAYGPNPDRDRAKMRQWYHQNRASVLRYARVRRAWIAEHEPWRPHIYSARHRAKTDGLPFDLTAEWGKARWTSCCELTGLPFRFSQSGDHAAGPYAPSLDRIVPEAGYTKANCRFILHGLNSLKGVGTDEDMRRIAMALVFASPY